MSETNTNKDALSADHNIDITGLICPMTFVRTKLMLEKMAIGEVLRVRLKGKEPLENVPRSARQHGHAVLSIEPDASDPEIQNVWIKKDV